MNQNDFVIATKTVNGIDINSVGIVNCIDQNKVQVYFVGQNECIIAPRDSLSLINVSNIGDDFNTKICNICHILKPIEEFSRNQMT